MMFSHIPHARTVLTTVAVFVSCAVAVPIIASAFPFGGQIYVYHVCHNETIFARLSPPVPGDYVWTKATKTYQFGPPRAAGQWLLGLTGVPFDCLWSRRPLLPVPAIAIAMMGSSGPAAPMKPGGAFGPMPSVPTVGSGAGDYGSYTPDPTQPYGPTSPDFIAPQAGKILISEVFYNVDAAHGSKPMHQWVEIYNGTSVTQNVTGWSLRDNARAVVIPGGGQIPPGGFLVIAQTADVQNYWDLQGVTVVALQTTIGDGLSDTGDVVMLQNAGSTVVDAVSWGTNTSAFSPSAPSATAGQALSRISLIQESDRASDWRNVTVPSPGH